MLAACAALLLMPCLAQADIEPTVVQGVGVHDPPDTDDWVLHWTIKWDIKADDFMPGTIGFLVTTKVYDCFGDRIRYYDHYVTGPTKITWIGFEPQNDLYQVSSQPPWEWFIETKVVRISAGDPVVNIDEVHYKLHYFMVDPESQGGGGGNQ